MADIASPIKTLGNFPAVDPTVAAIGTADQIADGGGKVMMTDAERARMDDLAISSTTTDDGLGSITFALRLPDGKMPLQFDAFYRGWFKPQPRFLDDLTAPMEARSPTAQIVAKFRTRTYKDDANDLPFPVLLAFREALSGYARSFVKADGGFAGKAYTLLFARSAKDDALDGMFSGIRLTDGKYPLQFDAFYRGWFKPQPRFADSLQSVISALWRGPAGATDRTATADYLRGRVVDTALSPGWRGPLVMPRAGTSTVAIAAATNAVRLVQYIGQSNSTTSGTDTEHVVPANLYPLPYQMFRFAGAGHFTAGGTQVLAANYGDLFAAVDPNITGGQWPMISAGYAAHLRARAKGYEEPAWIVRSDGQGGIPITYLLKGDAVVSGYYYYENARETRKAAKTQADAFGLNLDAHIVFVQGEDPSIATDLYQTYFSQIINDHLADSVSDIGKTLASFIALQTNGSTGGGSNDYRPGPLAHIAETRARRYTTPRVALAGPMYHYPMGPDDIHVSARSRVMHGDFVNMVRQEIVERGSFTPLDIARRATAALAVNQGLRAAGLSAGTKIMALGTGTGGTGTYTINTSQTVGSAGTPVIFTAFGAVFWGYISGTTLTVTQILDGALDVAVSGSDVAVRLNRRVKVDRDWVPDVGSGLGFEWTDASSRTISSADVAGDLVTLRLSGAPTGAMTLGYAISSSAAPYLRTGGAANANWAAPRGLIYADSGWANIAYDLLGFGPATHRHYLVRLQETF